MVGHLVHWLKPASTLAWLHSSHSWNSKPRTVDLHPDCAFLSHLALGKNMDHYGYHLIMPCNVHTCKHHCSIPSPESCKPEGKRTSDYIHAWHQSLGISGYSCWFIFCQDLTVPSIFLIHIWMIQAKQPVTLPLFSPRAVKKREGECAWLVCIKKREFVSG